MSQAQRFLGFVAATVALLLAVFVLGPRLLGIAGGPEVELVTRLKKLERTGIEVQLPNGTLRGEDLQFQRISVTLDAAGTVATVTCTLDFNGNFQPKGADRFTRVSSLGLERFRFTLKDHEWVSEQPEALPPRLGAIVTALEDRRRMIERGENLPPDSDVARMTRRVYLSEAWFIRSEREDVTVSEDYRMTGETRDRPIDEKATKRLSLAEDTAAGVTRFRFPDGIM